MTGSSLGAVTHPIMLNNIFHSTAGFAWGVRYSAQRFSFFFLAHANTPCRISAFLDLGLLVAANLLMRTRLPSRKERPNSQPVNVKNIMSDVAYMLLVAGSASPVALSQR